MFLTKELLSFVLFFARYMDSYKGLLTTMDSKQPQTEVSDLVNKQGTFPPPLATDTERSHTGI